METQFPSTQEQASPITPEVAEALRDALERNTIDAWRRGHEDQEDEAED